MFVVLLLFFALLVVVAVYVIRIYNGLVALRENVRKAWSNIDVLLTQRHDELPKLVETCKRYMAYGAGDARARDARTHGGLQGPGHRDVAALGAASSTCAKGLGRLFAVAENYPDLKADQGFRHLQSRHHRARGVDRGSSRALQRAVNLNNIRIQTFPDLVVARMFDFKASALLEFAEERKRDVDLGKLFG